MPGRNRTRVWLGLGGNLADPERAMAAVLQDLDARDDCEVGPVSGLYRSPPWGVKDQPDFLNCCAGLWTTLEARALLDVCLALETSLHRVRSRRWGPRTIDTDILLFGDQVIAQDGLEIPHPRMGERAFVLVPLAEIAPDVNLKGETIAKLAARIDKVGLERLERPADWWRQPVS